MARTSPAWSPGTEVLSIDGVATAQILAALMTVARADGSNDAKRVTQMEVQGFARIEAFDVYLPLLFPQISADPGAAGTHAGSERATRATGQRHPTQRSAMRWRPSVHTTAQRRHGR